MNHAGSGTAAVHQTLRAGAQGRWVTAAAGPGALCLSFAGVVVPHITEILMSPGGEKLRGKEQLMFSPLRMLISAAKPQRG